MFSENSLLGESGDVFEPGRNLDAYVVVFLEVDQYDCEGVFGVVVVEVAFQKHTVAPHLLVQMVQLAYVAVGALAPYARGE